MSFTQRVIESLLIDEQGKTCCRKAMLCGLFWDAELLDNRVVRAEFSSLAVAERAAAILAKNFSATPEIEKSGRAGRYWFSVSARSKALWALLQEADGVSDSKEISEIVDFRCDACTQAFARGAFMAFGHINDPQKSYHAEFSLSHHRRAVRLANLLTGAVTEPKFIDRNGKTGVYYKRNMAITDLLYYIGEMQIGFEYSDTCIMKNLRNRANKSTNFDASNISKSVATSQKQVAAIEELTRTGRLFKLPEEIKITAKLRMENPSATLSELANLHEPKISKSGLNRRLNRILSELENENTH